VPGETMKKGWGGSTAWKVHPIWRGYLVKRGGGGRHVDIQ
jgi:hypothetical protein